MSSALADGGVKVNERQPPITQEEEEEEEEEQHGTAWKRCQELVDDDQEG